MEIVGVELGVVDHRRPAGARDPAVDADLDRLHQGEEVAYLLGQWAGAGDYPQRAIGIEPLDDGQVVIEGVVQLADRDRGDVLDAVGLGEPGREPAGDDEAFVAIPRLGRRRHWDVDAARLHAQDHIGFLAHSL